MSEKIERHCTLLVARDESKGAAPTVQEIEADLESPDVAVKVEALKTLITLIIAGDDVSKLLMTVIRFCLNTEDHSLQKVLQLYWETVDKYDDKGALKPEMILVWCVAAPAHAPARAPRTGCRRPLTGVPVQQRAAKQPEPPE